MAGADKRLDPLHRQPNEFVVGSSSLGLPPIRLAGRGRPLGERFLKIMNCC
jgi:hypothetical protein